MSPSLAQRPARFLFLVVQTTNYNDKVAWRGASKDLKVTERLSLADETTIDYQFTIDDKATWDTPWKGHIAIKKADGHILSAARAEDAVAAGASGSSRVSPGLSAVQRFQASQRIQFQ